MPNIELLQGDCLEKMKELEDESVDAVITDPPAGIAFMNKSWDSNKGGRDKWIAWLQEIMEECNRVLKPGAHVVVWALPRTSHWTRMAIDNAGFEIRHIIDHIYSSGFPKSQNVGKKYDQLMGNEREDLGEQKITGQALGVNKGLGKSSGETEFKTKWEVTKGNSQWEGFGSALKPAHEDWILAMKPLSEKTIVENCIKHGTGALNIDGTRIPIKNNYEKKHLDDIAKGQENATHGRFSGSKGKSKASSTDIQGRFPADVIVSDDALDNRRIKKILPHIDDPSSKSRYFDLDVWSEKNGIFYCPKSPKKEKHKDNTHSTVKPLRLISWLMTLISKEGDTVLDPFMGSGTTGVAGRKLKRDFIGIEIDSEYFEIAEKRINKSAKFYKKRRSDRKRRVGSKDESKK